MSEEIDDDKIQSVQFQQWLRHPTTQLLIKAMKHQQALFQKDIISNANKISMTDQEIRYKCITIRDLEAMLTYAQDFETLKRAANQTN